MNKQRCFTICQKTYPAAVILRKRSIFNIQRQKLCNEVFNVDVLNSFISVLLGVYLNQAFADFFNLGS